MVKIAKPAAALQPYVRCYVHVESHIRTRTVIQAIPARTSPAIEFTFGDPYEIRFADRPGHETAHGVSVIGAQTFCRVHLAMHGHVETFVIVFQPGGLSRLFPVPADTVTDQHYEARALLGRSVDTLRSELGESGSFAERTYVADSYLSRRAARSCHSGIHAAAKALLRLRGNIRIADVAQNTGLSVRQFERKFVSEIGVSPKLYARVARFEAALGSKRKFPGRRWSDIAHELGYYDQMHMVHDFRKLSGSTPEDSAPLLDMLAPGEIDAAS
jgi:AraC-like DNA-binding protein